jgi:hypothetical protein
MRVRSQCRFLLPFILFISYECPWSADACAPATLATSRRKSFVAGPKAPPASKPSGTNSLYHNMILQESYSILSQKLKLITIPVKQGYSILLNESGVQHTQLCIGYCCR